MSVTENVIRIWRTKGQILEGITNNIFKKEDVEHIAAERMEICLSCKLFTKKETGCLFPGSAPCCNSKKGGCGCSLKLKTRSLSSSCPKGYWQSEMTENEEDRLNKKLGI